MILYDNIGNDYNTTRRSDPYISDRIYNFLSTKLHGLYIDIGCGTGNYLKALTDLGLNLYGADPSGEMLKQAKKNIPNARLTESSAENLPFSDDFFDGAIAVLTIHHWENKLNGLKQINRILKKGSKLVIFTYTPEQLRGYWLYHYFPIMITRSMNLIPSVAEMESMLSESKFTSIRSEKYFVRKDLQDHFMYSFKYNPEKYLLKEVRNGISGFRVLCELDELELGLKKLQEDIRTAKINVAANCSLRTCI